MGPEESMQIQSNLASTIAMAFDECPSSVAESEVYVKILWRVRHAGWNAVKKKWQRLNTLPDTINKEQMLFGINQGAVLKISVLNMQREFRNWIWMVMRSADLAVGETHEEMYRILDELFRIFRKISRLI